MGSIMDSVTVLDNNSIYVSIAFHNCTVIDSPYSFAVVSVEGEIMTEIARYSFNRFSYFIGRREATAND